MLNTYSTKRAMIGNFEKAKESISCFSDLNLTQTEFEQSLVLADISKNKVHSDKA